MTDVEVVIEDTSIALSIEQPPPITLTLEQPPAIEISVGGLPGPPGTTGGAALYVGPEAPLNEADFDPAMFWVDTDDPTVGEPGPPRRGPMSVLKVKDPTTGQWIPVAAGSSGGGLAIQHVDPDVASSPMLLVRDDGSLVGIPSTATRPLPPTGVTALVKLSFVRLSWTGSAGAVTYYVYRNGVLLGTTGGLSYRDETIAVGAPYVYTLRAANGYGMRGALSPGVNAQANAADNVAPTVTITAWPPVNQAGQKQVIRVAAADVDAQVLALTLGASAGSLESTADPSVWLLSV